MEVEELQRIYKLSLKNKKIVNTYLSGRKLKNSAIKPFGYITKYQGEDFKIVDSLVIPILGLDMTIQGLECRSLKSEGAVRYNKLFADELSIPSYALRSPNFTSEYCILVEGVMDAESLQQMGFNGVSGLRASLPNILLHYLALFFDKIILAFDNDKAGVNNAERVIAFYNKHYPIIEMEVLDYKGKDVNIAKQKYIRTLKKGLKEAI